LKTETGPVQIDRYNRSRQITVLANLQRDKKVLGEAVTELTSVASGMNLPPGYTYGFAGMADTMAEGFASLLLALFLSVAFIYMVLAAQFESFVHPFTIMLSIPLSITGAIASLLLAGHDGQYLHHDRDHHADGTGHEERHSACGLHQHASAAGWHGPQPGGDSCGASQAQTNHHDFTGDHLRHASHRLGPR
jgi:hypothetical protein